jgi:Cytochrome P460
MRARVAIAGFLGVLVALGSWSCGGSGAVTASINQRAALTGSLPWNPLGWNVITSSIDQRASTMSTLYGNDIAVRYARSNSQQDYPAGSVLSLVTWTQQDDIHWFGAKIPGQAKSVEFVSVTAGQDGQLSYSYESYEGSPLGRVSSAVGRSAGSRAAYLLSQRAAVMP